MLCNLHKRHGCTDRDCRLERIELAITQSLPVTLQTFTDSLQTITDQLTRIERKQDAMTMLVQEALDAIKDETDVIAAELIKSGDRVAALIAQLGTLTPAQEAEFTAIKAHQATLVTGLQGMAVDPANPVPTPVTPAPPVVTP